MQYPREAGDARQSILHAALHGRSANFEPCRAVCWLIGANPRTGIASDLNEQHSKGGLLPTSRLAQPTYLMFLLQIVAVAQVVGFTLVLQPHRCCDMRNIARTAKRPLSFKTPRIDAHRGNAR